MSEVKRIDPPKQTAGDHGHMLARAGIASVPFVGSAANELFNHVIAPPIAGRRTKWMNDIADGLYRLEEKQACIVDDLKDNDAFLDTVMQASMAAIRTSQQDKREALRNAVLNAALPNPPDESHQAMFVHFVDELTAWHLRLLDLLSNPVGWFTRHNKTPPQIHIVGSIRRMVAGAYPEVSDDLVEQCVADLQSRGLLSKFQYHMNMSGSGVYERRGTPLGEKFLAFITAPDVLASE